MKKLLTFLGLAGLMAGYAILSSPGRKEVLLDQIVELATQEAMRIKAAFWPDHFRAILGRFDTERLELFLTYLQAYVSRDQLKLKAISQEWTQKMTPIIVNSPEWQDYEGIIFRNSDPNYYGK